MAFYRVVLFAVLVSLVAADSHGYDLETLYNMFKESQQSTPTTQMPTQHNPLKNNDPRVAHTDFMVGRFDLASGARCKTDECRHLAKQLERLIVEYNVKVMHYIGDHFPLEHFYYHYTPLHFRSIDVVVITVYYLIPRPAENTTTTTSHPNMTGSPTSSPGGSSTTTRPTSTPSSTTTVTVPTTNTTSTTTPSSGTDYSYACSFEADTNSLCGAEQDNTDVFDWIRHSGGTPSVGTGPSGAQDGSYYMYIEASNPRDTGDSARLMLPANTIAAGNFCARFYYQMFGQHVGTLRVIQLLSSGQNTAVWSQTGPEATADWYFATAQTSLGTGDRLIFEGITGNEYEGDMAIDNVRIDSDLTLCSSK